MKVLTHKRSAALLIVLAFLLLACGEDQEERTEQDTPGSTVETGSPALEITTPVSEALLADARQYAADMGVGLDEAVRRIRSGHWSRS